LRSTIGTIAFVRSFDRVSVEEANCLIRLACANNGGGDPTSAYHADRLCRKPPKSTTEKKPATASGVGRMAQWARAST